jgi:hypothetical protein
LKPAELKAESERIRDEAKALAANVSAPLEETTRKILIIVLRDKLIEELSKIARDVDQKTRIREKEVRDFPITNEGKEVDVELYPRHNGTIGYDVIIMGIQSRPFAVAEMKQKGVLYERPESFLELIENLKRHVLDGNYDEELKTDSARLIYHLLNGRVR